jgi:hypothetical protein
VLVGLIKTLYIKEQEALSTEIVKSRKLTVLSETKFNFKDPKASHSE